MGCSPYIKRFKILQISALPGSLFLLILVLSFPLTLFAGTTGKIAGTILDSENREALIGANVIVSSRIIDGKEVTMAAPMGASTDAEGQYFILNLRPGTYVIEASFIGYQKQILRGVAVEVDRTTRQDFNLSPQSLTSEEIVVTAERSPMVVMDQTSASSKISGEDIKALPVENFTDVIKLTAGVTTGLGGDIHIRGGRSSEIQYYVDGIAVSNPFNNALAVPVENNAIQELEVISGTFNAEYGQAMSGIVNMVTREGNDEFAASLSAYTGDFVSNRTGVFYNIDDFDALSQKYIEGNLSGPLPFLKNVTFFASGKYQKQNNWLYGQRVFMPGDSTNMTSPSPDDYYIESSGDSAAVPMAPYQNFSGMFKLTWQLSPLIKVSYKFMGNVSDGKFYGNYYKLNPDYLPTNYSWSQSHFLKWDQQINSRTFYNVNIAYYERDSKNYKYENPADQRYRNIYKRGTFQPAFVLSTGGVDPNYSYQNSTTLTGRADLMMQVNKYNLVKAGIEGRRHRLQYEYYKVFVNPVEYNDYVPRIPPFSAIDHNRYDEEPFEFAAYIQDKIEIEDLIVNLGLRFDYFDPNSVIPANFGNPNNNPEYGALPEKEAYKNVKAKTQISPRLGLAFPISSQGVIHAAYGQFFQIPEFSRLYENREFEVIGSYSSFIGNADLDAQRTVMYEIGLQQQLNSYVAVDVTAFYRDIRNLLGTRLYSAANNTINYGRYINTDYGNVRGLTISAKLRLPESGITGGLDYTYQVASGVASDPKQAFYDTGGRNETAVIFLPLNWDLRHTANAYINYTIDTWGISVISRFNSGYPFTPLDPTTQRESAILELRNDGRYQSEFFMDLRAFKRFELAGYQAEIFLKVDNLLDTYRKDLLPELDPRDEQAQKDLQWDKVNSRYQYVLNPALQPVPREVKLGVKFDF